MPTIRMIKNIFSQNKKLIAVNDQKNVSWKGTKARHITFYCGKCYPLVNIDEQIFKTTQRRYIRGGYLNNKKIKLFWGDCWILHCSFSYCTIWSIPSSIFRSPFSIFLTRDLPISWFFKHAICYVYVFVEACSA